MIEKSNRGGLPSSDRPFFRRDQVKLVLQIEKPRERSNGWCWWDREECCLTKSKVWIFDNRLAI